MFRYGQVSTPLPAAEPPMAGKLSPAPQRHGLNVVKEKSKGARALFRYGQVSTPLPAAEPPMAGKLSPAPQRHGHNKKFKGQCTSKLDKKV